MRPKIFSLIFLLSLNLFADPNTCKEVNLSDIGWTDVSATTAVAAELLEGIGYEPNIDMLSVAVTFAGLKNNDVDVFLGNWMPTQNNDIKKYLDDGSVNSIATNLEGAKYTLAVPKYAYDAGLKDYKDIHKFADKLDGKIYGIEPGNDGNSILLGLIEKNTFGLKDFSLVESSEQGMLVSVKQALKNKEFIVFLGWAPHPMNSQMEIEYLSGGDDYFGPNFGASTVHTIVSKGYEAECPNVANFLKQLKFDVDSENLLMDYILTDKLSPKAAAQKYLAANPKIWRAWLKDIKTFDNRLAALSFKKHIRKVGLAESNVLGFAGIFSHKLPIGAWVETFVQAQVDYFANSLHAVSEQIEFVIDGLANLLNQIPFYLIILFLTALMYYFQRSWQLSVMTLLGLFIIHNFGLWEESIDTLVLVLLATAISAVIGIPLGVLAAKRSYVYQILRPVLDLMQTIPTFVYLIPTLMLFGLGVVPGLVSTIIFALPAPIRLTYLGFQNVPRELKEAGMGLGIKGFDIMKNIELPFIKPNILAGISQCIMLSLSMVVIAAMVGADGLGTSVVRALNTVNIQLGFESGLAIVILAILLDRTFSLRAER